MLLWLCLPSATDVSEPVLYTESSLLTSWGLAQLAVSLVRFGPFIPSPFSRRLLTSVPLSPLTRHSNHGHAVPQSRIPAPCVTWSMDQSKSGLANLGWT
jgi:hypothetical protein